MTTTPDLPHRTPAGVAPAADSSRIAPPSAKVQEALDARDALAAALIEAGVQLPAMGIRTPWLDVREEEPPYALIQLGVCAAPVAQELAEVIAKGAGFCPLCCDAAVAGEVVRDIARERVGRVMGREGPYIQLRPLGGGREWDVAPRDLRPMSQSEILSALVAELNSRSRRVV